MEIFTSVKSWIAVLLCLANLPAAPAPPPTRQNDVLTFKVDTQGRVQGQGQGQQGSELQSRVVCYEDVGCFSNAPPFNNAWDFLPSSPQVVATEFRLYTQFNQEPVLLDWLDPWATAEGVLDPALPTKLIIHGFGNSLDGSEWISEMTETFLKYGNYNVIEVGWNTQSPDYFQGTANTRLVGRLTSTLLEYLVFGGVNYAQVHLIGHSLGAHIAGYVSDYHASKIDRITGLDPAGPLFSTSPPEVRLDPSDARFVDVIHTNGEDFDLLYGGGFGTLLPSGHLDYYANSGLSQPGCTDGVIGGIEEFLEDVFEDHFANITHEVMQAIQCSHGRAHDIFIESISASAGATDCLFTSYACANYSSFMTGQCVDCGPAGCNVAGLEADRDIHGRIMYFNTLAQKPFCGHMYLVTMLPEGSTNELRGSITATFEGENGVSKVTLVDGNINMAPDAPFQTVVTLDRDLGAVANVTLHYVREDLLARRDFTLKQLELGALGGGPWFATPPPSFNVSVYEDVTEAMLPV